jgi:hypothetical protein
MKILTTDPQCEDFATFRFGSTMASKHAEMQMLVLLESTWS